ncbi:tail fiber domain-containing protein [Citrobacter freundii]|uniref:tail fiber domain-containing protein n=1 Tax=Citrobacter freundii TaxID=546 RepID=UPI00374E94EE
MTTYATNNPIGSMDPKDLFDNAQNLDFAVNDITQAIWKDRFGRSRPTMWGMEQAYSAQLLSQKLRFNYFIQNSGYKVIGEYTAGPLTITDYNQLIRYQDELWKLTAATDVPFTTSGIDAAAWANDSVHFVSVGDDDLRQKVMQSIVQLEDFGAVGDGVTDDTAAFVAANSALMDGSFISLIQGRNYKISGFTFTKRISIGCSAGRAAITSETGISWLTTSADLDITISNIDLIPTLAPDQNAPTNALRIEVTSKNFGSAGFARITGVNVERPGALAFYNGISVKNQPVIIEGGDIVLLQSHTNDAAKDGSLANWAVNSGDGILLDSATYSVVRNVKVYYARNAFRATGQIEDVHFMELSAFNNRRCYVFEGLTGSANEHRIWGCHGVTYLDGISINSDGTNRISLCSVGSSSILAASDATAAQIVYLSGLLDGANISAFQAFNNGTRGTNDIAVWLKTVGSIGSRRVFIDGLHARGVGTAIYLDTNERQYINGVSVIQVNMVGSSPVVYAYGPNNTSAPVSNAFGFPEQENVFPTGLMAPRLMATSWLGLKSPNTIDAAGPDRLRIREVSGNYRFESADATGTLQYNAGIDQGGSFRTKGIYPLTDSTYTLGTGALRWSTVYASTGSINTSDEREKTAPLVIDDTVLDAWGDVQFITFQWLEAIRQKGDDTARWHFGLIAQKVRDAFAAHGLDGTRYGLLCYDEWEDQWVPEIAYRLNEETGMEEGYITGKNLFVSAGNRWGIRSDQCLFLEAAYQRRNYARLIKRIEALEGASHE